MKSKGIRILLIAKGYKTSMWRVENKKTLEWLGMIKWYSQWRQYCFSSCHNIIYSQSCLKDITEFIKEQMDKKKLRKVSRKAARKAVMKISLCSSCFCMTKIVKSKCGKCKRKKG